MLFIPVETETSETVERFLVSGLIGDLSDKEYLDLNPSRLNQLPLIVVINTMERQRVFWEYMENKTMPPELTSIFSANAWRKTDATTRSHFFKDCPHPDIISASICSGYGREKGHIRELSKLRWEWFPDAYGAGVGGWQCISEEIGFFPNCEIPENIDGLVVVDSGGDLLCEECYFDFRAKAGLDL